MNNREKIDEIVKSFGDKLQTPSNRGFADRVILREAILAALDAVLEAEPSEEMIKAGSRFIWAKDVWKDMAATLRSELKL